MRTTKKCRLLGHKSKFLCVKARKCAFFFVTRIPQMTQMLLVDGERLPQAENLRNLCDAKSTLILSAIRWESLFSPKKWQAIQFDQQKTSSSLTLG